jgi:hypothetical protein
MEKTGVLPADPDMADEGERKSHGVSVHRMTTSMN